MDNNFRFPWEDDNEGGLFQKLPRFPNGKGYYGGCKHWRVPVRVGRYVVTCSSKPLINKITTPPIPDFGIYMDYAWRESLGRCWTNGSYIKVLAQSRLYPALFTEWKDFGVIPVEEVNQLVEICWARMRRGLKVDIGCAAGHGRTGTLLACLIARLEHINGDAAIKAARERYCHWAVETKEQEKLVKEYSYRYRKYQNRRIIL